MAGIDPDFCPAGRPRAYQSDYDPDLVAKVAVAMGKIAADKDIAGTINARPTVEEGTAQDLADKVRRAALSGAPKSGAVGERFVRSTPPF